MIEPKPKNPGGRPRFNPADVFSVGFKLRLSTSQRAKLDRLGGAAWLRERIDRAKEPTT